jgi:hypothetical protein
MVGITVNPSVLMPIRILLSILTLIRIRILPEFYTCWKSIFLYKFFLQKCKFTLFYRSRQRLGCHNIEYYGQYIEIFWKKDMKLCRCERMQIHNSGYLDA